MASTVTYKKCIIENANQEILNSSAITRPLPFQINNCYHYQLIPLWRKYDAHPLPVMCGAFQRIGYSLGAVFNFLFVEHPFLPDFLHFTFVYFPAVHSAKRMLAVGYFF